MGLFTRFKDPVDGTAQVVAATAPADGTTSYGNVSMTLVVQAEGIPTFSTEHGCMCRASRWPYPGATLPVTVERDKPTKLKVRWDEVATGKDQAQAQADAMVAAMSGQGSSGQSQPGQAQVDAILAALGGEAALGINSPAVPQGDPQEEMLEHLERLSALHTSGALTDEEFAAQKARLLNS